MATQAPSPVQQMTVVNVSPDGGIPSMTWDNPAWKQLQIWSIVHVVFEAIYIVLAILTTGWSCIWPIMVLIGASNIACKCCCRDDGGKCIAQTMVILTSIALIGSFVDIAVLAWLQGLCNEWDVSDHPICQFITIALAFCVICLVLRMGSIVLAGRVCCGCCGAPPWKNFIQGSAAVTMTAMPAQQVSIPGIPVNTQPPKA
jgi:hypothetical protein